MAYVANCKKFDPNMFNKNKCGVCFRSKHEHSAAALETAKSARKVTKCGYLFIAHEMSARRWQHRFFILYDDGELSYSVDESIHTVPQGVLDMNACEDIFDAEEVSSHQFSIALVLPQKTEYIKGSCKEEINRWYDVLIMYPKSNSTKRKRTLPATPVQRSESTGAISTRSVNAVTPKTRNVSDTGLNSSLPSSNHVVETKHVNNRKPETNIPARRKLNSDSSIGYQPEQTVKSNNRINNGISPKRDESESQTNGGTKKSPSGVSYRGVRSLKHKGDASYQESLRKSNSFTDLRTDGGESVCPVPLDIRKSWDDGLDALDSKTRRDSRGRFSSLPLETTRSPRSSNRDLKSDGDRSQPDYGYSKLASLDTMSGSAKRSNSDRRHYRVQSADARENRGSSEKNRGARSFSVDSGSIAAFASNSKEVRSPSYSPVEDEVSIRSSASNDNNMCSVSINTDHNTTCSSQAFIYRKIKDIAYLKKGWLHKQNRHSQEWTKHWFVLGGSVLKYFRDARDEEANHIEGKIDLATCQEVKELETSRNYGFSVRTKNGVYVLSAMTSGIRNNWIQALMNCREKTNNYSNNDGGTPRSSEKPRSARRSLPTVGPKTSSDSNDEQTNRRNTVTVDWKPNEDSKTGRPLLRMYPPNNGRLRNSVESYKSPVSNQKSSVDNESDSESESDFGSGPNSRPASDRTPQSHRFTKRSESATSPFAHNQSQDEAVVSGNLDDTSGCDQNGLHNPSPIEKKLNKLRSKIPRVRSPPPPSSRLITDVEENLEGTVQLSEPEKQRESTVFGLLEVEVESLQGQLEQAQRELITLHEENTMLKSQMKNTQLKSNEDSRNLLDRCGALEDKVIKMEKLNNMNGTAKSQLELQVERLILENDLLKQRIGDSGEDSDASHSKALKEVKIWKRKYEEREDELVRLQQTLEEQRVEIRKKKKQIKGLEIDTEEFKSKFAENSHENERLKNEIKDVEGRLEELSKKSYEESRFTKNKDDEIVNLRTEFEALQKDYADVMNKYNDLSTDYQQAKDDLLQKHETSQSQGDLCEELHTEIQTRKQECENLAIDLMQVTEKYESLLLDHNDMKVTLKDSLQILDSQKKANDYKDEQIENCNELLEKKCVEYEELLNRYDDLTSEFEDLKLNSISTEAQLRNEQYENKKNECEVKQLTDSLKEKCIEFDELSDELAQIKANGGYSHDSEALLDDLDAKDDELDQLREELEEEKREYVDLQSRYDDLLVELDATKIALQVSESAKSASTEDLLTSDERNRNVTVRKAELEKENSSKINYSDHVNQVQSLNLKIRTAEDKSDELELRNNTLIQQMQITVDKYQDEVKSYGARIDDLVKKLRTAQLAKLNATKLQKLSERSLAAESDQLETELQEVERKIEQVENDLLLQENATDELKVQLGSVERQVGEKEEQDDQKEQLEDMLLSPRSDASFVTVSEGVASTEISIDSGPSENWNEHRMVERIQGLHEKVAQSNMKLREVLSILDEESEDELDLMNEKELALKERLKICESKMDILKRTINVNNCDKLTGIICQFSTLRFIAAKNIELNKLLIGCKQGLDVVLSSHLENKHSDENLRQKLQSVREQTEISIQAVEKSQAKAIEHLEHFQSLNIPVNLRFSESTYSADLPTNNEVSISNKKEYFEKLQCAIDDVDQMEDLLASLQASYEKELQETKDTLQSEITQTFAQVNANEAEIVATHSTQELCSNDKEKLIEDLIRANEKIKHLEKLVDKLKDTSAGDGSIETKNTQQLMPAQSNSSPNDDGQSAAYAQILADCLNKEIQNNAIVKEYQEKLLNLREQQMHEFQSFSRRMKSVEDYLNTMTVINPEMPKLFGTQVFQSDSCAQLNHTIHKDLKAKGTRLSQSSFDSGVLSSNQFQEQDENWLYMQTSTLAAKAMAQAELTYRITKIRDGLVNSSSVDEYLKILEQELSLALTKLQNRERLMHEILTAFRRKKLQEIASIIVTNDNPNSIHSRGVETASENTVLSKIRQLVLELAGFYRTLDTVGDTADIHARLDRHVQTEIDLVSKDLKYELSNVSQSSADTGDSSVVVFTEETITTMIYNLADSVAQSAVVAAQSAHLSDIKTDFMEGFQRSLGNESIDSMTFPNELEFSPRTSPRGDQILFEGDHLTKPKPVESNLDDVFSDDEKDEQQAGKRRSSRRNSSVTSDKQFPRRESVTLPTSEKKSENSHKTSNKRSKADIVTKRASTLKRNLAKSEPNLAGKKTGPSRGGISPARSTTSAAFGTTIRKTPKSRTRSLTPSSRSNIALEKSPFTNKPALSSTPVKRPASLRPPKLPPKQPFKLSPKKNEDRIFASFSLSHGPSSFDLPHETES